MLLQLLWAPWPLCGYKLLDTPGPGPVTALAIPKHTHVERSLPAEGPCVPTEAPGSITMDTQCCLLAGGQSWVFNLAALFKTGECCEAGGSRGGKQCLELCAWGTARACLQV